MTKLVNLNIVNGTHFKTIKFVRFFSLFVYPRIRRFLN
jgi:hypothetical protein